MAHTLIIVAYEPAFTMEFRCWIKTNITPSMISQDETTSHYSLDFITTQLEEQEDKENRPLFQKDASLLKQLQNEKVEYVEF